MKMDYNITYLASATGFDTWSYIIRQGLKMTNDKNCSGLQSNVLVFKTKNINIYWTFSAQHFFLGFWNYLLVISFLCILTMIHCILIKFKLLLPNNLQLDLKYFNIRKRWNFRRKTLRSLVLDFFLFFFNYIKLVHKWKNLHDLSLWHEFRWN